MYQTKIKVSVLLAVYNGEKYLKAAIDSILDQTFVDFEFVIVDDGSTDSSGGIIISYNDPRIVFLVNKTNEGLISSLNSGLSICRGKYVARMDCDDIALPERLQAQFDYMESHPDVGICGSNVEAFFNTKQKSVIIRFPETDELIKASALFHSPFSHPSVMMRKSVLSEHKLRYSDEFLHAEDYALWVELLKYTKAYNFPKVLLRYRIHEKSVTAKTGLNYIKSILVQNNYFHWKNIALSLDDTALLSRFVNRYGEYSLNTLKEQQTIDGILADFFAQLNEQQKEDYPIAMDFVSSACFYRFFRKGKYPQTPFLKQLYWRGLRVSIHKLPVYLKRLITRT
jgi:glycosyltransferase involved in cell wall biosynthesis